MTSNISEKNWIVPLLLYLIVLAIFVVRTLLAISTEVLMLFDIFNLGVLFLSVPILFKGYSLLTRDDVLLVIAVGLLLGISITFTTFYAILRFYDPILTSIGHGVSISIILSAGLIMRKKDGPVHLATSERKFADVGKGILVGLLIGIPFAVINAYAFTLMEGQPFIWQDPFLSALRALQPGMVEEIIYRLAFLNMLWFAFSKYVPNHAVPLAAFLSLIVHNYSHMSDLLIVQPVFAIAYGAAMGLLFGLPPTILALRRNLESAMAFHWIVDFVRFLSGF
ncbi:MAG: type II CAAX prenyl endopeptidase Rce1 family protein [Candidatus Thorarchaeota archaeon]